MSRAAAASQAGRPSSYPDNAATGSRPHPTGRGSPVNPSVVRQPRGAPGACGACAALAAALAHLLRHHTGELAVAVADLSTGVAASYHGLQPGQVTGESAPERGETSD
jgi:hypothetical protein